MIELIGLAILVLLVSVFGLNIVREIAAWLLRLFALCVLCGICVFAWALSTATL